MGYSSWGCKESQQLSDRALTHVPDSLPCEVSPSSGSSQALKKFRCAHTQAEALHVGALGSLLLVLFLLPNMPRPKGAYRAYLPVRVSSEGCKTKTFTVLCH